MPEVDVVDRNRKAVSKVNVPEEIFAAKHGPGLVHDAVVNHLANRRQGTACTKNRSLVRGGGRKPFRQKGTGRARQGSTRSPLQRGGGTVFGPTPRSYAYAMPKKMKRAALRAAFSAKFSGGEITVVEDLNIEEAKTRRVADLIRGLGLTGRLTFILPEKDEVLERASRNIPMVKVLRVGQIGVYDVVNGGHLVITAPALQKMEEVYKG